MPTCSSGAGCHVSSHARPSASARHQAAEEAQLETSASQWPQAQGGTNCGLPVDQDRQERKHGTETGQCNHQPWPLPHLSAPSPGAVQLPRPLRRRARATTDLRGEHPTRWHPPPSTDTFHYLSAASGSRTTPTPTAGPTFMGWSSVEL